MKKRAFYKLEKLVKNYNNKSLAENPGENTTKNWLAETASILKHLGEKDYQEFLRLSKSINPTTLRGTRISAAHEIDVLARRKLSRIKTKTNTNRNIINSKGKVPKTISNISKSRIFWPVIIGISLILIFVVGFGYRIDDKVGIDFGFLNIDLLRPDPNDTIKEDRKISDESLAQTSTNTSITVRPLEPLETDKDIGKLPNGIFGYAYAFLIESQAKNNVGLKLSREPSKNRFEVQKIKDEIFILGYVDEVSFSEIGELNGSEAKDIILFPTNWKGNKHPAVIPINSIKDISTRDIEVDDDILGVSEMPILELVIIEGYQNSDILIQRDN